MSLTRTARTLPLSRRRLRPTTPSCRGGASSVIRLTKNATGRLPNALDLSDWMDRATSVLMPVTGPLAKFVTGAAPESVR